MEMIIYYILMSFLFGILIGILIGYTSWYKGYIRYNWLRSQTFVDESIIILDRNDLKYYNPHYAILINGIFGGRLDKLIDDYIRKGL